MSTLPSKKPVPAREEEDDEETQVEEHMPETEGRAAQSEEDNVQPKEMTDAERRAARAATRELTRPPCKRRRGRPDNADTLQDVSNLNIETAASTRVSAAANPPFKRPARKGAGQRRQWVRSADGHFSCSSENCSKDSVYNVYCTALPCTHTKIARMQGEKGSIPECAKTQASGDCDTSGDQHQA